MIQAASFQRLQQQIRQAIDADAEAAGADARIALRAVLLGALHGPLNRIRPTYLSNQCTRTFAPKPGYAVRFWRERNLRPPLVDVLEIVRTRAHRYYGESPPPTAGGVLRADSRLLSTFVDLGTPTSSLPQRASRLPPPPSRLAPRFRWVVTSPPYFGMRSYIPDQWLRHWFVGGPARVCYTSEEQLSHGSAEAFAAQLAQVWRNVGSVCEPGARLVVRYGGIPGRKAAPIELLLASLRGAGWRVQTHCSAGTAAAGRRQALHFARRPPASDTGESGSSERAAGARHARRPIQERDVWAVWQG